MRYLFGYFLLHLTQSYTSSFHLHFVFQDIWILNKCILSRIEKRIFRLTCFARNLIDFRILTLHLFILAVQNLSKFERISCNEKMQYTLTYNIAVFTSILIPLKWVGKVKHWNIVVNAFTPPTNCFSLINFIWRLFRNLVQGLYANQKFIYIAKRQDSVALNDPFLCCVFLCSVGSNCSRLDCWCSHPIPPPSSLKQSKQVRF